MQGWRIGSFLHGNQVEEEDTHYPRGQEVCLGRGTQRKPADARVPQHI